MWNGGLVLPTFSISNIATKQIKCKIKRFYLTHSSLFRAEWSGDVYFAANSASGNRWLAHNGNSCCVILSDGTYGGKIKNFTKRTKIKIKMPLTWVLKSQRGKICFLMPFSPPKIGIVLILISWRNIMYLFSYNNRGTRYGKRNIPLSSKMFEPVA